jgi:hypothetical protein
MDIDINSRSALLADSLRPSAVENNNLRPQAHAPIGRLLNEPIFAALTAENRGQ